MVSQNQGVPALCCRHGGPATQAKKVRFYSKTPVWVFLFLLLGVLPLIIAVLVTRKTLVAPAWPFCSECERARRQRIQWAVLVGAVGPLALVLPLFVLDVSDDWAGLAVLTAFVMVLAGLLMAVRCGWASLHHLQTTGDGGSLIIKRPAPAFVAGLPPAPVPYPGSVPVVPAG